MSNIGYYPVIDDSFRPDSTEYGTGYQARDYEAYPLANLKCARSFSQSYIPRSEYADRIREKTEKKTWIKDHCERVGLDVKDQGASSYCWMHAPVRAIECERVLQNDRPLTLSAFWGASLIKRGRNEGGSGIVAVEFLHEHGTPVESLWPPQKFSGERTEIIATNASQHTIESFVDIDPADHAAIITSALTDDPVTVGIPAWRHEVLITFLVWEAGEVLFGFDNSWGKSWGYNGRGILKGSYTRFNEACIVQAVRPSIH